MLGPGPWGASGSPTSVGRVRVLEHTRARACAPDLPVAEQVAQAVALLRERGAFTAPAEPDLPEVPGPHGLWGPAVVVVVEPDRARLTAELLSAAAEIAEQIEGHVVAFGTGGGDVDELGGRGADRVVIHDATVEERVAHALRDWSIEHDPWAVLAPSTTWGREVAARAAAQLGAGLTGDAVELEVAADGRLVVWKPAFGGALVAAIRCASPVQMVTVRAGMLAALAPRGFRPESTAVRNYDQSRVEVLAPGARRRPRRARRRRRDPRGRPGRRPGALRRTRTAAARAARRDRRHPQGHRLGMVAPGAPDRDHRTVRVTAIAREHRRGRQVQPQRRLPQRRPRARDQSRAQRADLRFRRRRGRRRSGTRRCRYSSTPSPPDSAKD